MPRKKNGNGSDGSDGSDDGDGKGQWIPRKGTPYQEEQLEAWLEEHNMTREQVLIPPVRTKASIVSFHVDPQTAKLLDLYVDAMGLRGRGPAARMIVLRALQNDPLPEPEEIVRRNRRNLR